MEEINYNDIEVLDIGMMETRTMVDVCFDINGEEYVFTIISSIVGEGEIDTIIEAVDEFPYEMTEELKNDLLEIYQYKLEEF